MRSHHFTISSLLKIRISNSRFQTKHFFRPQPSRPDPATALQARRKLRRTATTTVDNVYEAWPPTVLPDQKNVVRKPVFGGC